MKHEYGVLLLGLLVALSTAAVGCTRAGHSSADQPNVKVIGVVTDADTGQPVKGARVADNIYGGDTDQPCREAWTDENGGFTLATWYEEHSLVVSAPGYPPTLATLMTKPLGQESQVEMNFRIHQGVTE